MATFALTPITGFPPPASDEFPNFIQFQEDGVNLGGPNADVVNFTGAVSATRGEGENSNVVTVNVVSSGSGVAGSVPVLVQVLEGNFDTSIGTLADWEIQTELVSSPDASFADNLLTVTSDGVYEITVRVDLTPFDGATWTHEFYLNSYFNQYVSSDSRASARHVILPTADYSSQRLTFTDTFFFPFLAELPSLFTVQLSSEVKETKLIIAEVGLVVTRRGDIPLE